MLYKNIYLIIFLISAIFCAISTNLIYKYSIKKNIGVSKIRNRDIHKKPIPRIGGLGIFLTFWLIVFIVLYYDKTLLEFTKEKIFIFDKNLFGLFVASLIWCIVGIYDDIKNIKPYLKLIAQFICGFLIVFFGIKIWWIINPQGGLFILSNWTYLLVPLWIVLIMNILNWFDGIDGLTPSISLVSIVILFFLSINAIVNQSATALLCAILAGCLVGFIPYNWNPAKIFLGDIGSGFLGLMIATFAIISGAKLATAFLVLGIPILDAIIVIVGRFIRGKSIFLADKTHLHHKFLSAGFSIKQTVFFLSLISLSFGLIALKSQTIGKLYAVLWLILIMAIILIGLNIIKNKKYARKK